MSEIRYSVFTALNQLSDEAILEAELPELGKAVLPPHRKKAHGLLVGGWIAAAVCAVVAIVAVVALIRTGHINPIKPPDDTTDPVETTTGDTNASTDSDTSETAAEPVVFVPWNGSTATKFAGGSGTYADPYLIETPAQLAHLAGLLNAYGSATSPFASAYYRLEANLDLKGREWTPIGAGDYPFSGYFDGNGHTIRNVTVTTALKSGERAVAGLFGSICGGTVRNLSVSNVTITITSMSSSCTGLFAGGLAGYMSASKNDGDLTIMDCKINQVSIKMDKMTTHYTGGLAGRINVFDGGSLRAERIQATKVYLNIENGEKSHQGLLAGYVQCDNLVDLRDVCLEGSAKNVYTRDGGTVGAVVGVLNNRGGRFAALNVFARLVNSTGYVREAFAYKLYGTKDQKETFSFENVFVYSTTPYGSNIVYYATETELSIRNCAVTQTLPANHGFSEAVWDLSDLSHPRLK